MTTKVSAAAVMVSAAAAIPVAAAVVPAATVVEVATAAAAAAVAAAAARVTAVVVVATAPAAAAVATVVAAVAAAKLCAAFVPSLPGHAVSTGVISLDWCLVGQRRATAREAGVQRQARRLAGLWEAAARAAHKAGGVTPSCQWPLLVGRLRHACSTLEINL